MVVDGRSTLPRVAFDTLLVAVDVDDRALAAIREAAGLARHFRSKVVLAHFLAPATGDEQRARSVLDGFVRAELEGISARVIVEHGDPVRGLLGVSHAQAAKLVVVGRPTTIIGSVTQKLLLDSDCPVLSCGPQPRPDLRHIVCGVDFTRHDADVIEQAAAMASALGARLTIAHATPPLERYGPGGRHAIGDLTAELVKASKECLDELVHETGVDAAEVVRSGDVATVLDGVGGDLLVIGRYPAEGVVGGTCYDVVRTARVPVLAV